MLQGVIVIPVKRRPRACVPESSKPRSGRRHLNGVIKFLGSQVRKIVV